MKFHWPGLHPEVTVKDILMGKKKSNMHADFVMNKKTYCFCSIIHMRTKTSLGANCFCELSIFYYINKKNLS